MERKNWLEQMKEFEDSSQEQGPEPRRRKTYTSKEQFWKKPYFLGGLGLILLLFFISLVFSSGEESSPSTQELQGISKNVERLEQRLAAVEDSLKDQQEEMLLMQSADSNLGDSLKKVTQNMQKLQKQMQGLETKVADIEQQGSSARGAAAKEQGGRDFVYHEVQSGENLFRISQRHDTTVERIRELNGLDPDQPIQPGQKLKVGTRN
jgi:LysM repeat protein